MSHSLEGATVLVTGGAGLVGSHIVDGLVDEGAREIRVLDNLVRGRRDNLKAAFARRPLVFVEGDVRDRQVVRAEDLSDEEIALIARAEVPSEHAYSDQELDPKHA